MNLTTLVCIFITAWAISHLLVLNTLHKIFKLLRLQKREILILEAHILDLENRIYSTWNNQQWCQDFGEDLSATIQDILRRKREKMN